MKALLPWLVLAAALAACDHVGDRSTPGPLYIHGSADPRKGEGMVSSVSKLFERAEVEKLHARLNSKDFQEQLTKYSCGDQVPKVDFTLSLWPEGEYQERHVLVQPRPMFSPTGRRSPPNGPSWPGWRRRRVRSPINWWRSPPQLRLVSQRRPSASHCRCRAV